MTNLEKRNSEEKQRKLMIIRLETVAMRNDSCTLLTNGISKKKFDQLFSLSIGNQPKTRGLNFLKHGWKETLPSYKVILSQGWCWIPISEDLKSLETTDLRRWFECTSDLLTVTSWNLHFSLIILNKLPAVSICFLSASLRIRLCCLCSHRAPLCG